MNSALLTIATLVLFVGAFVGSLVGFSFSTGKLIGFFFGGRLASYTEGDAISARKHRRLLVGFEVIAVLLGAFALTLSAPWLGLVLACSVGAVFGVATSFWLDRHRLLPAGWPRQSR